MPPRKNSILEAAALIAAGAANTSAAPRTRSRTPTAAKKKVAAAAPAASTVKMSTAFSASIAAAGVSVFSDDYDENDETYAAAGAAAPPAHISRASSMASIPSSQAITPAVSAPPTPSGAHHYQQTTAAANQHGGRRSATLMEAPSTSASANATPIIVTAASATNGRSSASMGRAGSQPSAAAAAIAALPPHLRELHDTILRCDDYADLSVLSVGGSMSAGSTTSSSATAAPLAVRRAFPASSAFTPTAELQNQLRAAAAAGGRVTGLFNKNVDVGAGVTGDPIKTPLYPNGGSNDTGCWHCTHTSHCDCEYVADVFFDVFENQLTQKRITERSTSSVPTNGGGAAAGKDSRSRSQSDVSSSAASSNNTSFLNDLDERSNGSNAGGYNAAPAALSSIAVTSKVMVGSSTRHLCAKSLLPPFVSRLIRLMDIQPGDSFYDFGCGNGSILFQVALSAGATCVGIELCPHNAQLARDGWSLIKPIFESKLSSAYPNAAAAANNRPTTRARAAAANAAASAAPNVGIPHVEIITGDITNLLSDPAFFARPRKILLSNLLFPKELSHFIAAQCRKLPKGSMVVCFDDLYPHGRSVCKIRDPEAFELFHMTDYEWPKGSVEWCYQEGKFYIHTKKQ